MSNDKSYENRSIPNIKYVIDHTGKGWLCDVNVKEDGDLHGQGCVAEEDWLYDRMFGG